MDVLNLLIALMSGAAASHMAASASSKFSLGVIGCSLTGTVGGGLAVEVLNSALGTNRLIASLGLDVGTILSEIAAGGLGGLAMTWFIALIRAALPGHLSSGRARKI